MALKTIKQFLNLFLCWSLAFSPAILRTDSRAEKLSPSSAFLAGQVQLPKSEPISLYSFRFPYVIAHELGHWAVGKWFGLETKSLNFGKKDPHVEFKTPPTNQQAVRIYQGADIAQTLLALFSGIAVVSNYLFYSDVTFVGAIGGALLISGLIHLAKRISIKGPTSDQINSQAAHDRAKIFPNQPFLTARFNMDEGLRERVKRSTDSADFFKSIQDVLRENRLHEAYQVYQNYLDQLRNVILTVPNPFPVTLEEKVAFSNFLHQVALLSQGPLLREEIELFPISIKRLDEQIQYYTDSENGVQNQQGLTLAEFEFYIVQLIQKLKALGERWSVDSDRNYPNHLSRSLIWKYFKERLSGWQQFPVFGDEGKREENARHTVARILANFDGVKELGEWEEDRQALFRRSTEEQPLWENFGYLPLVWLRGSTLTSEDLIGTNLKNQDLEKISPLDTAILSILSIPFTGDADRHTVSDSSQELEQSITSISENPNSRNGSNERRKGFLWGEWQRILSLLSFPYVMAHEWGHYAQGRRFGLEIASLKLWGNDPHVEFTAPPTNQQAVHIYEGAEAAEKRVGKVSALVSASLIALDGYLHSDWTFLSVIAGALLISGLAHLIKKISLRGMTSDDSNYPLALQLAEHSPDDPFITARFNMDQERREKVKHSNQPADFLKVMHDAIREERWYEAHQSYQNYRRQLPSDTEPDKIQDFTLSIEKLDDSIRFYTDPKNQKNLTQPEFEFYFVQLIHKLKALGDGWSVEKHWAHPNHLCRSLIWKYFRQRLSRWEEFPVFGEEGKREENARHTFTRILANFYGVKEIPDFKSAYDAVAGVQQSLFRISTRLIPYTINLGNDKQFQVWLQGSNLTSDDLCGTNLTEDDIRVFDVPEREPTPRTFSFALTVRELLELPADTLIGRNHVEVVSSAIQNLGVTEGRRFLIKRGLLNLLSFSSLVLVVFSLQSCPLSPEDTTPVFISLGVPAAAAFFKITELLYTRIKIGPEIAPWTGLKTRLGHFGSGVRTRASRVSSDLSERLRRLIPAADPEISL